MRLGREDRTLRTREVPPRILFLASQTLTIEISAAAAAMTYPERSTLSLGFDGV